jgi:hypothetical protein
MANELIDQAAASFGHFDPRYPRDAVSCGLCLSFSQPRPEARSLEIQDVIATTASLGALQVGLAFWLPQHERFLPPEPSLALLASHGIGHRDGWQRRILEKGEDFTQDCWFYSQGITLTGKAARTLAEVVNWADFGAWKGVLASVYLWSSSVPMMVSFWDNRGCDALFASGKDLCDNASHFAKSIDQELSAVVWPASAALMTPAGA